MHTIAESTAMCALGNLFGLHIGLVVNQATTWLDGADKNAKLFKIVIEGWEDIDMVPSDAANHRDMRMIVVELRHTVDGRSEILIAFHDHIFGCLAEAHHHIEAFQLCPNHEIGLNADLFEHMKNHGGDGSLAVAAADNDTGLVLALLVEVFRIGIHFQTQFLGTNEFRVIDAGVHAEDDGVIRLVELLGIPAPLRRQDAFFGQT